MVENTIVQILILEDSSTDRMILESIVSELGYSVRSVTNGAEGLDAFRDFLPDIILCDVLMPIMGGLEFATHVSKREEYIPIIFLTSLTDTQSIVEVLEAGGSDFLSKPYNATVLQAKLKVFVRQIERIKNTTFNFEHVSSENSPINNYVLVEMDESLRDMMIDVVSLFHRYLHAMKINHDYSFETHKSSIAKFRITVFDNELVSNAENAWKYYLQNIVDNRIDDNIIGILGPKLSTILVDKFNSIQNELEILRSNNTLLLEVIDKLGLPNYTIVNNSGETTMKIKGNFTKCSFADKIESVVYEAENGFSMDIYHEAVNILKNLDDNVLNDLRRTKLSNNESFVKRLFDKHGIAISENLAASGIYGAVSYIVSRLT